MRGPARHSGILRYMRWLIYWIAAVAWAAPLEVTPSIVRQGETVRIAAPANGTGARMNGRTIRLFPDAGGTFGLMPVPVEELPGSYKLEVVDGSGAVVDSTTVTVRDAHYPSQNIVIAQALAELKPAPGE